ncbi:MAG: 50S ribosomal protein L3 [Myxococcales bacterium]|nr:50S ribosomal protein L3 [Myxococcales bacterium]
MQGILGQKVGMTAVYNADGQQIPVTVIRTAGNVVLDKRTEERDGYTALVLGFGERPIRRANKPLLGFFKKQGLIEDREGAQFVKRHIREFRVDADTLAGFEIGASVESSAVVRAGEVVDVIGTSKGRGFTGVMKRHNFRGTKASHGVHEYFRHGGAISSNTYPARVFKNRKMPGQHGNRRTTVQNVQVVEVLADEGMVLLRGGVPGPNGGLVMLNKAVKKHR